MLSKLKLWATPILVGVLITLNAVVLTAYSEQSQTAAAHKAAIVKSKNKFNKLSNRLEEAKSSRADIKSSLNKAERKSKQLEKKSKRLQRENDALKERKEARLAAQQRQERQTVQKPTPAKPKPVVASSGGCESWMASAGIRDLHNARELIRRESGCNPHAVNASSGACGVAQELPCGKSGCSIGDGACQVSWMHRYVKDRYGSWAAAINFHNAQGWY